MNSSSFLKDNFDYVFNNLISAIVHDRKRSIVKLHAEVKDILHRRKARLSSGVSDQPIIEKEELIKDEDELNKISNLINALQDADTIILHSAEIRDASAIRIALDIYNRVLQQNYFNNKELSSHLAKRIKRASKILSDILSESSDIQVYKEKTKIIANKIQFTAEASLTPDYLILNIAPWIKAVVELQAAFNAVQNKENQEIRILSITQRSPISLSLSAGAEAIKAILEVIVPWRRKHAKIMAEIEERSARLSLELQKAEINEKNATTESALVQAGKLYQETRKLKLDIDIQVMDGCRELAYKLATENLGLTQSDDIENAVVNMLPPLVTLTTSDLDVGKITLSK